MKNKRENGQSLVELAFVLPLLVLLLFSIIDIGFLAIKKNELNQTCYEITTYVAGKTDKTANPINTLLGDAQSVIDADFADENGKVGSNLTVSEIDVNSSSVSVKVTENATYLTGLPSLITRSSTVALSSTVNIPIVFTGTPYQLKAGS